MALMSVAEALAPRARGRRTAAGRSRAARRGARPRARRRPAGAADAAAGRCLGHGRLRGARRRCRARAGAAQDDRRSRRRASVRRQRSAPGEAARIFTGGVVPPGADTIVIQENTTRDGDVVVVDTSRGKGRHIRVAGLDFATRRGRCCAQGPPAQRPRPRAGRRDEPSARAGAPPAQGRGAGDRRRTGDAGRTARPGRDRLFQRLSPPWRSRAARAADVHRSRHRAATASTRPSRPCAGRATRGADILVTSGGASVGDHDLVQKALAAEGHRRCRSGRWRCGPAGR